MVHDEPSSFSRPALSYLSDHWWARWCSLETCEWPRVYWDFFVVICTPHVLRTQRYTVLLSIFDKREMKN